MIAKNNSFFFMYSIIILVLIGLIALFFIPKISYSVFPSKREASIEQFIGETISNAFIDPQDFWSLRDLTNRGIITSNSDGFSDVEKSQHLTRMSIDPQIFSDSRFFFSFHSKKWESLEGLVPQSVYKNVARTMKEKIQKNNEILFETETEIIGRNSSGYWIFFIKPIENMKVTNGFLDYEGRQKELVSEKVWVSISHILL